jgi:hypothetical protein
MNTVRLKRWPRPLDAAAIILSLAVIVFIGLKVYADQGAATRLVVESDRQTYLYPIDQDRIIEIEGPLGITTLEIAGGRARFIDSPCPDKLCIAYGWLEESGNWTACLPNKVFAAVEGGNYDEQEIDFLSY